MGEFVLPMAVCHNHSIRYTHTPQPGIFLTDFYGEKTSELLKEGVEITLVWQSPLRKKVRGERKRVGNGEHLKICANNRASLGTPTACIHLFKRANFWKMEARAQANRERESQKTAGATLCQMPSSKWRQILEGALGILFSPVPEDAITVRYCLQGEQGEVKGLGAGCLFCMSPWFDTARQLVNSLNQGSNINSHSFHSLTVCRLDNVKHPNITAILCLCVCVCVRGEIWMFMCTWCCIGAVSEYVGEGPASAFHSKHRTFWETHGEVWLIGRAYYIAMAFLCTIQ